MDSSIGNNFSHGQWSIAAQQIVSFEDRDVKPRIGNISIGHAGVRPHNVHDFSIHVENCKEYNAPVSMFAISMERSRDSRTQRKCSDTYVAQTCCGPKKWSSEDVSNVISTERTFFRSSTIIIKFPDKKVNKQIVKKFHKTITAVNFLHSPYARRCCVTLEEPSECREILTKLNSTRFGSGYLSADCNYEELIPSVDDIDPFTLFLDNIPLEMEHLCLLSLFPDSQQITVGYTNKTYYTKRYAFIIYSTVMEAIEAFKNINGCSDVIVRFRRFSGSAHLPCESDIKKHQGNIGRERLHRSGPVITDSQCSVLPTDNSVDITHSPGVKNEPTKRRFEDLLLEDDDDDDVAEAETTNNDSLNEFEVLYEQLKRSRMEMGESHNIMSVCQ